MLGPAASQVVRQQIMSQYATMANRQFKPLSEQQQKMFDRPLANANPNRQDSSSSPFKMPVFFEGNRNKLDANSFIAAITQPYDFVVKQVMRRTMAQQLVEQAAQKETARKGLNLFV